MYVYCLILGYYYIYIIAYSCVHSPFLFCPYLYSVDIYNSAYAEHQF